MLESCEFDQPVHISSLLHRLVIRLPCHSLANLRLRTRRVWVDGSGTNLESVLARQVADIVSEGGEVWVEKAVIDENALGVLLAADSNQLVLSECEIREEVLASIAYQRVDNTSCMAFLWCSGLRGPVVSAMVSAAPNLTKFTAPWVDSYVEMMHSLSSLKKLRTLDLSLCRDLDGIGSIKLSAVRELILPPEQRSVIELWAEAFPNARIRFSEIPAMLGG